MATTVSTLVKFSFGAVELVGELSGNLAVAINAIDVSSKASGNETNWEYGRVSETGSATSLASTDPAATSYGYQQAKEAAYAKTKIAVVVTEYDAAGDPVVGAINVAGSAVLTSVSWDMPDNDKMGLSIDFNFDGKTVDTVNV